MVVDLPCQVRVVLFRALEHDFGAIGEFMRGQVDLSKATLADESAEGIIADGMEVCGGEFAK